jgi:glycine/D-amino acid oxidase-like deaminating enzyme/nitrite reductase/ring-hydroxylating ferredoxin subunit
MAETGKVGSFWHDTITTPPRRWPALTGNIAHADVAIIGAGITGLSIAWHLVSAGKRVVIIEADEVGHGTTGSSTGNLYSVVGPRLHAIAKKHGEQTLRAVIAARSAAIDFIEARVKELGIVCDFERVPFHLFSAPDAAAAKEVQHEFDAAQRVGLPSSDAIPASFPFRATALTTVADQAQFNPLKYVIGLAAALADRGCSIHENSRVLDTEDGEPCIITTATGRLTADDIVKATHTPQGLYAVHAAMIPHREYAVMARVNDALPPSGIYWNANSAWRYSVRPWRTAQGNFIMVLGEDHKPGEQDAAQLDRISQFLHQHFDVAEIPYTWAAQNYRPADLLPYIGRSPLEKHTWMATGFAADGLVWGTFAGQLISDELRAIANPRAGIFSPTRFTPIASAKNFLLEQAAVSKHLVHDVLSYGRNRECAELAPGAGCVVTIGGEKVAASRDHEGRLHVVAAHCTHLGCLVHWNPLELSWDCPCHGSRFDMDGRVLEGPAQKDLALAAMPDPPRPDLPS